VATSLQALSYPHRYINDEKQFGFNIGGNGNHVQTFEILQGLRIVVARSAEYIMLLSIVRCYGHSVARIN
jgi:hypothetical protein